MFVKKLVTGFSFAALVLLMIGCNTSKPTESKKEDLIGFKLLKVFPHDINAFTQGLVIYDGKLYESTGREGSWISEVNIGTGAQTKKVIIDDVYFGEGITILNNKVYQLTWQNKIGFVYQWPTFEKLNEFQYNHEGWGITHDGTQLIVSDGTDKLHFLDTASLKEVKSVSVKYHDQSVEDLNELEFIEGFVYANQWQTNNIFKIDPATGLAVGILDLSSLRDEVSKFNGDPDVLNGIAYEPKSKMILVTGKLWPVLFALKLN